MPCSKVSVNVALCGSIPRGEMAHALSTRTESSTSPTKIASFTREALVHTQEREAGDMSHVPSWAVPAQGDARLEPVCEAVGAHNSLDLTDRPAYVIGRSPCSDLQLFHSTCSRLHAILVHHKNGSCLIKDLQSGHGTFVNGLQVPPNVWSRIKKGSLVRFGGIGGPSFVLKSFCVGFDRMISDLDNISNAFSANYGKQTNSNQDNGVACIRGDGGMACILDGGDAPAAALVLLHTRLNACGGHAALSSGSSELARRAQDHFITSSNSAKRDRDEISTPCIKLAVPHLICDTDDGELLNCKRRKKQARVRFSDEKPQLFYPPSVTPDELSSDDEGECEDVSIALLRQMS